MNGLPILVTGGTGTFGNAVVRRYLNTSIKEIRVFSRDELKQEIMRNEIRDPRVKFFLGDVRDISSLKAPMTGVSSVFHAAALKQVPSCEFFPQEAIKTNAIGAENVFNAAIDAGVKKVVALSTDKAVYPINSMGQSKALMEKLMIAKSRMQTGTVLCATRYGNVIASRGSVIPKFIEQIVSGNPITITNPEMTRCMMTIDEALDLVLYAFDAGSSGDIFIKKVPAATLLTVVDALKEIFDAKNPVQIIGTRHGEKLYETLITCEEMSKAEDCGDYYRIPMDTRDMNYALYFSEGKEYSNTAYTSQNARRMSKEEMVNLLKTLDCVQEVLKGRD